MPKTNFKNRQRPHRAVLLNYLTPLKTSESSQLPSTRPKTASCNGATKKRHRQPNQLHSAGSSRSTTSCHPKKAHSCKLQAATVSQKKGTGSITNYIQQGHQTAQPAATMEHTRAQTLTKPPKKKRGIWTPNSANKPSQSQKPKWPLSPSS